MKRIYLFEDMYALMSLQIILNIHSITTNKRIYSYKQDITSLRNKSTADNIVQKITKKLTISNCLQYHPGDISPRPDGEP